MGEVMDPTTGEVFEVKARSAEIDKLAPALVEAQKAAGAVEKDKENTHHRYAYASAEAMIAEAKAALAAGALALLTLGWRIVHGEPTARVFVTYWLVHSSGQWLELESSTPVVPDRGRPWDKAEFAALTANLGYVLRGVLLLAREDQAASVDGRDDRSYEPGRDAPPKSGQQQQPPPNDDLAKEYMQAVKGGAPAEVIGALQGAARVQLDPTAMLIIFQSAIERLAGTPELVKVPPIAESIKPPLPERQWNALVDTYQKAKAAKAAA